MGKTKPQKIGIYSPYLAMLGGGERYIFSIASTLSQKHQVFLYADKDIQEKSRQRFGIPLKQIHFLPEELISKQNLLNKYFTLREHDLFFYMTDGSVFFSGAQKNLLLIQSPLHIPKFNFLNKLKLSNWRVICYSQFMQDIIRQKWGEDLKISALPPCIDIPNNGFMKGESKENIILSVGRFFPYPHDKKHEVLIDIFKSSYKKSFNGWKLVIAGGLTEEGGRVILEKLIRQSKTFPIEIKANLSSKDLTKLYQQAKIYWHAAGFGEDLINHPEKAEHFGIAPLEAMAYGAVPVVFNGGGLKDIISEGAGGYLWDTKEELINKTSRLTTDSALRQQQAHMARQKAQNYSCGKFYAKLEKIIEG